MGTIAFFPWLHLEDEVEVQEFRLLRYQRGEAPGVGDEQAAIDRVLSAYRDSSGHPVNRATIIQHSEQDSPTAGIEETFHLDFFVFAELLAFSGLAARSFFGPFGYSNRDHYRLVLQDFTDPERGVLVTARRRDGSSKIFFSGDTFVAYRPTNVGHDRPRVDRNLVESLLSARSHDDWPRIYQGVLLFNEANTDRLEVSAGTELIMTYAAIEQIIDMAGRPPSAVADRFSEVINPQDDLPPSEWRVARDNQRASTLLKRSPTLRNAWVKDLGISRGSVAHGHAIETYPASWQPHEHLLLGGHIIPLLMKVQLQNLGLYKLTADDIGGLEVFEHLLNEDHFERSEGIGLDQNFESPWLRITSEERFRRHARRRAADRLRGGPPPI